MQTRSKTTKSHNVSMKSLAQLIKKLSASPKGLLQKRLP